MTATAEDIYSEIATSLSGAGLYSTDENGLTKENTWRISTEPYFLSTEEFEFIDQLGHHLLKFYSALNQCYLDSAKGKLPGWIAEYLDAGKSQDLIDYSRMKRFKNLLPGIIRPDLIVTEAGFSVTELDSVPGGFGLTARLMSLYQTDENNIIGHENGGIPELFYQMATGGADLLKGTLGIIVSDEAEDYRSEMVYLADLLKQKGVPVYTVHPREVIFKEEGLFVLDGGNEVRLDVIYRFFELFDLKNIPKSELFLYSNKKGQVQTTPPYKPFLEEKLSFALFHHPALTTFWEKALGPETFAVLSHLIPKTWVLDNREIPPHGVIPGLVVNQTPVRDWRELFPLSQKQREFAIKPSGFSPLSWGSRGVVIGHDVPGVLWQETLENSLAQFPEQPSILQEFHKGKTVVGSYYRPQTGTMVEMKSRVRLTPYYFVVKGSPQLGGILATLCPHDKKKIHGMTDAIMVPCAVRD
jgi:hypothetical protein